MHVPTSDSVMTNAKTKCSSTSVCPTSVPVHFKSPIPPNDSVMTNTSDLVQTESSSTSVSSKTTSDDDCCTQVLSQILNVVSCNAAALDVIAHTANFASNDDDVVDGAY